MHAAGSFDVSYISQPQLTHVTDADPNACAKDNHGSLGVGRMWLG